MTPATSTSRESHGGRRVARRLALLHLARLHRVAVGPESLRPDDVLVALGRDDRGVARLVDGDLLALDLEGRIARLGLRLHDQRDRADLVALARVHHPDAGGRAALLRDALDARALDHPVLRDEHQLLVRTDDERTGEAALRLGQLDRQDALRSARRLAVLVDPRALAVAGVGDDEQVHVVAGDVHGNDLALLPHVHAAHAAGV